MLLRNRPPGIDSSSVQLRTGLEHLEHKSTAVLRWLNANKIDYVVVGPVAHAIRGDRAAKGAVSIVPAPYGRNYERLTRALVSEHAGLRSTRGIPGMSERIEAVPVKLSAEKLSRGRRWMLRFGAYDLDVESPVTHADSAETASGAPGAVVPAETARPDAAGTRYQELLYDANRFTLAEDLTVQVASLEDLEHYSHVRRTGSAPEFRVTRNVSEPSEAAAAGESEAPDGADGPEESAGEAHGPRGTGDSADVHAHRADGSADAG